jgi:hypothetical protein
MEEVTAAADPKERATSVTGDLRDDDSEFEDITDRFESSYNFRFEEP